MKILIEEFNSSPTAKQLEDYIKEHHLDESLEIANAQREYWQNQYDTLVLRLKNPNERLSNTFEQGIALGKMVWEFNADEFDSVVEDYRTYYRIWWD